MSIALLGKRCNKTTGSKVALRLAASSTVRLVDLSIAFQLNFSND